MAHHKNPQIGSVHNVEPEMGRFKNSTQMVFHPTEEDPNVPNAGVLTYLPGSGFPEHRHDFAQVWYVLEGTCQFGDHTLKPGDMVYMPDSHVEYEMKTEEGCKIVFLQFVGPTTGVGPIYNGRFNVSQPGVAKDMDLQR